jgi:hypothetical protein
MGERVSRREAVDRMTGRLVKSGIDPKTAKQKAIEAATRKDRKEGR